MTTDTDKPATHRRTLVKTIKVDGDDMTLSSLAEMLDDLVCEEMENIENDGGDILGPVSISQAHATMTDYPEGTHRTTTTVERGLVATITYRIDIAVGDDAAEAD